MSAHERRRISTLRDWGKVMARAFHDPNKIEEMTQTADDLKAQASAMGLETEPWWDDEEAAS